MVPPYTSFPPVSSEKVSLASPFFAIQQAARGRGKIDRHTSTRQEEADEVEKEKDEDEDAWTTMTTSVLVAPSNKRRKTAPPRLAARRRFFMFFPFLLFLSSDVVVAAFPGTNFSALCVAGRGEEVLFFFTPLP